MNVLMVGRYLIRTSGKEVNEINSRKSCLYNLRKSAATSSRRTAETRARQYHKQFDKLIYMAMDSRPYSTNKTIRTSRIHRISTCIANLNFITISLSKKTVFYKPTFVRCLLHSTLLPQLALSQLDFFPRRS